MFPERRCSVFGSDKLPPLIGLVIYWNAGGSAECPSAHRPHPYPQLGPLNCESAVCNAIVNGKMGIIADPNYVELITMLDRLHRRYLNVVRLGLEAMGIRDVNC